jgi:hypothetical protein
MLGLFFRGIKAAVFALQLVLQTPGLQRWRLDQVYEVGFATWNCWESGLPHNLS